MNVAPGRRPVDLAIMRGGTSRGPVVALAAAPLAGPERDHLARSLIGSTPVDGLGGGTPITSKVVLVWQSEERDADLGYIVGNLDPAGGAVDWSGTCGNMTAAVVPYAAMTGLLAGRSGEQRFRLRNQATDGLVDVTLDEPRSLQFSGAEVRLTTSYLDPGGSVLGATLPTGHPRDQMDVDGEEIDCTIVDVTHPYLLLRYDRVVGRGDLDDRPVVDRIERIRGTACVLLGLCRDVDTARHVTAAVPRVVLVHAKPESGVDVRVTAVSMGHAIPTVPVTAAMNLAAAVGIDGTLVSDPNRLGSGGRICVAGPSSRIRAEATFQAGRVSSASVQRTARCLIRGTSWV